MIDPGVAPLASRYSSSSTNMRTKKTKLPKTPVNKTHAKTPVAAANPPMVLKEITIAEARSLSKEPDVDRKSVV